MPVPNTMADLATLAGSNSPAGSEAIGNSLDNYLRAISAILRSTNALASATIAAASTTDLASADGESVQVTGSATITSFGTGFVGCRREVRFSGTCVLVNSANLVLPNANSINTSSGDVLSFRCTASGVWALTAFNRLSLTSQGVTNFIATLLDDADAATARATLGAQASLGYTPVNRAGDTMTGLLIAQQAGASTEAIRCSNSVDSGRLHLMASTAKSEVRSENRDLTINAADPGTSVNIQTQGTNRAILNSSGITFGVPLTLGSGKKLTQVTVSNSAPGTLADGELYLRY